MSRIRSAYAIPAPFILAALLLIGCGSNGNGNGPDGGDIDKAWELFEEGNYVAAIVEFHMVHPQDEDFMEVHNGLGWSFAFSGTLDSAAGYFEMAALGSLTMEADVSAGLSAVRKAQGDYEGAIAAAASALTKDANWTFAHYGGTDYRDLHLILAQSYYALGPSSYSLAHDQVDILDPANGLDPQSSSYAADLLLAIEAIERQIGAVLFP